jgi:PKD repeat protein
MRLSKTKLLSVFIIGLFIGTNITSINIFENAKADSANIFYPSHDATIHQNSPNSNAGSGESLTVRNKYGSSSHPYHWQRDALVKFDITSIPSGSTINSATLKLYYYNWLDNNPAGRSLKLYRATSNWNEGTVTWNTQPSWASQSTTQATVPSSTGVWMSWDVTNDIQSYVNGIYNNYGWKITDENYWGDYNIPLTYLRSKEYSNNNLWPKLEINFEGGGNQPNYFLHFTDIHYGYYGARDAFQKLINLVLTDSEYNDPSFVLITGDILSWGASSAIMPITSYFYCDALDNSYFKVWLDLKPFRDRGIPVYLCPGNHDFAGCTDLLPYVPAMDILGRAYMLTFGPKNTVHDPLANVKVIGVNSGFDWLLHNVVYPPRGSGLSLYELYHISSGLENIPLNNVKIIYMHHPVLYHTGSAKHVYDNGLLTKKPSWEAGIINTGKDEFMNVCSVKNVDLVLSGHMHGDKIYLKNDQKTAKQGGQTAPISSLDSSGQKRTLYVTSTNTFSGWVRKIDIMTDHVIVHEEKPFRHSVEVSLPFFHDLVTGKEQNESCPATLHYFGSDNCHVGRYNISAVDYSCDDVVYVFRPIFETDSWNVSSWNATEEEIVVFTDDERDDFHFEVRGVGYGYIPLEVSTNLDANNRLFVDYSNISMNPNSTGYLYMNNIRDLSFNIKMDIDNDGNIDYEIFPDNITISDIANFSYTPDEPMNQSDIYFYDLTNEEYGSVVNWSWDFGDGNVSFEKNPVHIYQENGFYLVSLSIQLDNGATDVICKELWVFSGNYPPFTGFSYSPYRPNINEIVNYTDLSTDIDGSIVSWYWNFGDGNSSNLQHPSHQYAQNGTYNITLTVNDDGGLQNNTSLYIQVMDYCVPVADFNHYSLNYYEGHDIFFEDYSYDLDGFIVNWTWTFGDGNTSYLQHPTHQYTTAGHYTVCLTVMDDDGATDEICKQITVIEILDDVNQSVFDREFRLRPGWNAAQDFTPTYQTLSRVELYMTKFAAPSGDVTVEIREDSTSGDVVFSGAISPGDVPAFPTRDWVSVDVGDLMVSPGEKYVIVLKDAQGASDWDCLLWSFYRSSPWGSGGPYDGGWFWFQKKFQPYWFPSTDWDFTFKTYGYS